LTVTTAVTKQPLPISYVILDVPTVTPVTMPVLAMVATAGVLLLQVPPGSELDKVVVEPRQAINIPVIAPGVGVTVTTATVLQPATVYSIEAVPGATPVTMPVDDPTVATVGAVLLQVPPALVLASGVV
jgi:hypothetical protein